MKKYKEEVRTITTDIETGEVVDELKTDYYIIKNYEELTDKQKEEVVSKNYENISQDFFDNLYHDFQAEIEFIKEKYKDIKFDTIYLDENSQGKWIDSITKFEYLSSDINIFSENISVYDIDIHISKYIKNITEDNIYISDYYIDNEKMEKIKSTKKYKTWINKIINYVNKWIDEVNSLCEAYFDEQDSCFCIESDPVISYFENTEFKYSLYDIMEQYVDNASSEEIQEHFEWYKVNNKYDLLTTMYESYLDNYTEKELFDRFLELEG